MKDNREMDNRREYYDEYEIDLREYIMLIWEHKWFITAFVIIAVLAAFFVSSFLLGPVYETKAKIQLSNYEGIYSQPTSAVQLLSSTDIMSEVMKDLNLEMTSAELSSYINNNVEISNINNTPIISLSIKNKNPEKAVNITETLIDKYRMRSQEYFSRLINNKEEFVEQLKADLEEINQSIQKNNSLIEENRQLNNYEGVQSLIEENSGLKSSRQELRLLIQEEEQNLLEFYPLEVIDSPYTPENPVSPNIRLNIAIAAVLALMLAVFIIFFKEFMKEEE